MRHPPLFTSVSTPKCFCVLQKSEGMADGVGVKMSDLKTAARRIGEATTYDHSIHCEMYGEGIVPCYGCRAERAALVELKKAVAEEREACAAEVDRFSGDDKYVIAYSIRSRGAEEK